jgi:hypothetical protein
MDKHSSNAAIDGLARILDPIIECLSPEVAGRVAQLEADPSLQARIDELAEKCNDGQLTVDEEAEYDAYVRAMDVLAVLQAKARFVAQPNN